MDVTSLLDLRAVVFDYGMVLSGPPDPASHRGMIETTGVEAERFDECYWANRDRFDSGELDGTAYWHQFARDSGITLTSAQLDQLLLLDARMWMSLNEPVLAWAQQVRASGMKIAILSNIGDTQVTEMRKQFGWLTPAKAAASRPSAAAAAAGCGAATRPRNRSQSCSTVANRWRTVSSQGTNSGRSGSPSRNKARLRSNSDTCFVKASWSAAPTDKTIR